MSEQEQNNQSQPDDGAEKSPQNTVAARYGFLGLIGQFKHPPKLTFTGFSTKVIVKTDRGIEIGQTVNLTCSHPRLPTVQPEQIVKYVQNCGPEYLQPDAGQILRIATDQDLREQHHLNENADEKIALCKTLSEQRNLSMKLIACEHLFGGERIIFYFMSEGRIDFRDLVRDLAREYHTRIEMRQIGARDEARLVADYEICGRECCCKNFLKTLRPVSMKMAKTQKATLDPSKVTGRCGRLRCCLRFEQETYQALSGRLPRTGSIVLSEHGPGRVTGRQIITQLVQLAMPDGRRLTVPVEELTERDLPASAMTVQPTPPPPPPPPPRPVKPATPPPASQPDKPPQTAKPTDDKQPRRSSRRRRRRSTGRSRPSGTGPHQQKSSPDSNKPDAPKP